MTVIFNSIYNDSDIDRPSIGTVWKGPEGGYYTVEGIANEGVGVGNLQTYPITVVYRHEDGRLRTKPLRWWHGSMVFVRGSKDQQEKPDGGV